MKRSNILLDNIILLLFNRMNKKRYKTKLKSMDLANFMSLYKKHSLKRVLTLFLVLTGINFSFAQGDGCKVVVIDAGHGGKDPGCSGKGSREKTIALGIALKLGKLIEDNHKDVKVVYTRKSDVFVELDERANIANKNKADLFICIHANANAKASAYGAETYVLGLHKTEAQKQIANRENSVISFEDNTKKYEELTPDMLIARTMQLSVFLNQSILFANDIQKEFKKIGRKDRGVKQAGFVVLFKTTMPSVLIESGFLTNTTDNEFLIKGENQQKMAQSIYNAFKTYKSQRDEVADVIKENNIEVPENSGVQFKVQIASSRNEVDVAPYNFKGLEGVEKKKVDAYYRYFYGNTSSYSEIKKIKEEVKKKGYSDAFVIAYLDGERISLKKAINLASD